MSARQRPHISVVVPIRNEERYLRECLNSLVSQDYPPERYEIVVADGRSTDRSREIVADFARRYMNLRMVDNPGQIVSCGRNAAIRASLGEVIAAVEGHARVAPDFLSQIERLLNESGARCLGRYVESAIEGDSYLQRAIGLARKSPFGRNLHSLRFTRTPERYVSPQTVATVYRRSLLEQVGLYDEQLSTNEDVELNYRIERAGVSAYISPQLCYWLHPRSSLLDFFRQAFHYGHGKRLLVRKHPQAFRWVYLAPSSLVLAVSGVAPLALMGGWFVLPLGLLSGSYALAVLTASLLLGSHHGLRYIPVLPILFPVMHVAFGVGYLVVRRQAQSPARLLAGD